MTQKDLNRMMGQPHAALEGEAANKTSYPLLVMYNYFSKDIVDFVINNVGASGGLSSPFIMFDVGDGTESSQPPLAVSNIYFVIAEYNPGGDVDGHIINIHLPEGVYYCTDTSGSFDYTV